MYVAALPTPGETACIVGHGHVFKRIDGYVANCGGPESCAECDVNSRRKAAGLGPIWETR